MICRGDICPDGGVSGIPDASCRPYGNGTNRRSCRLNTTVLPDWPDG